MSTQIFKQEVPRQLLVDILHTNCEKQGKSFVFNKNAYKKGYFNGSLPAFLEECKPYYHQSKKKYLERKQSYNSCVTILRQLCNLHRIHYTSKIHYLKSSYEIVYYIYLYPTPPGSPRPTPQPPSDAS